MKRKCLEIECGYLNSITKHLVIIILELVNAAANALIAKQAAAARLLTASQALQACREENNPYSPSSFFTAPRTAMWAPDPCLEQEKELAAATIQNKAAQSSAQVSNAPAAAALEVAPAPQLSSTSDGLSPYMQPEIPITEFMVPSPAQSNMWSPDSILDVMDQIMEEMEALSPGSTSSSESIQAPLQILYDMMVAFLHWMPKKAKRPKQHLVYNPRNQDWIGRWGPIG